MSRGRPRHYRERGRLLQPLARAGAALLGAAALAGLVVLLAGPTLRVQRVDVSGNHRLTTAQVVAAAGLERPGSALMVDPDGIRRRLAATTWVRSASVSVALPDRVGIQVEEWQPVALYRAGGAAPFYVSDQAVALGPAGADAQGLVAIQGPAQPAPQAGRQALDRGLLVALVNIQRTLPGVLGQDVRSFAVDGCGNLTMTAGRGWQAQFGRVLTPEEFASLKDKVSALKALQAGGMDFNSPDLQYVNLMNPALAAVKDRSVKPSPAPTPTGRRTARTPTPAPSPPPCS